MSRRRLVPLLAAAFAVVSFAPAGRALAQTVVQTERIDPFGQEITLAAKTIVYMTGSATWSTAFDTLVGAFKTLQAYLDKEGLKASGPPMTIYTGMDDTSFNFQAALPVAERPKKPPEGNIGVGTSPEGKALKFVHRGSFESTTSTYDAITHYVDEKQITAQELLIEEYVTDLATTADDKLIVNIFVPLK